MRSRIHSVSGVLALAAAGLSRIYHRGTLVSHVNERRGAPARFVKSKPVTEAATHVLYTLRALRAANQAANFLFTFFKILCMYAIVHHWSK